MAKTPKNFERNRPTSWHCGLQCRLDEARAAQSNNNNTFFHVRLVRERAVVVVALCRAWFGKTASKAHNPILWWQGRARCHSQKYRDGISTMRRATRVASPVERAYTTRGCLSWFYLQLSCETRGDISGQASCTWVFSVPDAMRASHGQLWVTVHKNGPFAHDCANLRRTTQAAEWEEKLQLSQVSGASKNTKTVSTETLRKIVSRVFQWLGRSRTT